jgi:5-methylcytosine-specific restriction endonuclease McrA
VQPVRGSATTNNESPAPSANTIELETVKMHQINCLIENDVMQMLDRCKELLSGKHPRGIDYNTLMMELASDWLEKHDPVQRCERRKRREEQKKAGGSNTTGAPGTNRRKEPSRYIGPATRDAVHNRDKGRCTYVGSTGRRCESRWDLEIHHDGTPYALGGGHSIHNLRLLCASHNMLEAERVYGQPHMEKYCRQRE